MQLIFFSKVKLKQPFYRSGDHKAQISTSTMATSHKPLLPKTKGSWKNTCLGSSPWGILSSQLSFHPATYDDGWAPLSQGSWKNQGTTWKKIPSGTSQLNSSTNHSKCVCCKDISWKVKPNTNIVPQMECYPQGPRSHGLQAMQNNDVIQNHPDSIRKSEYTDKLNSS